jgi:HEPN domain-containing protein
MDASDLVLLFNTARAFEEIAFRVPAIERLHNNEDEPIYDWDVAVGSVNSALALELYLKALWVIERGEDPPKTHRLDLLFDGLSNESRNALSAAHRSASEIEWSVREMLEKSSFIFEEYRYPHEWSKKQMRSWSYELFVPAIFRERILELRPGLNRYH